MYQSRRRSSAITSSGARSDALNIPIDPNGNLASQTEGSDSWVYSWNAENQLTKVEKNGAEVARFAYDPNGRRVEKVAGGVTTSYAYDGASCLREVRGSTTLKYVHGPGVDEPLAVDDGSALTYFHADGLGSIVKSTSQAGAVTLTRQYDAWGNLEAGGSESGYAFTGREWGPEIGLYYYRARYYDPKAGRFVSDDPARGRGGPNWYAYVGDTPTSYRDPAGLWRVWGNWCGPDWTGGRTEQYNPDHASSYLPPIDDNDAACMRHDFCYYTCRKGFRCDKANRVQCMRRCDRRLASETGGGTSEAGMVAAFNVWIVMRPPRTPDAGTNESCGCPSQPPPPANGDTCYGGLCFANPGAYF